MLVLMVIPDNTSATAGNRVTAQRLADGLEKAGWQTKVVEVSNIEHEDLKRADVVHCFHALKSAYKVIPRLLPGQPFVVTMTGTDLEEVRRGGKAREEVRRVVERATALIVFHQEALQIMLAFFPEIALCLTVVPQAPHHLPPARGVEELRRQWHPGGDEVVFLFAGGIRRVKDPVRAVKLVASLHREVSSSRLVMVGPALDLELVVELHRVLASFSFASYLGEIPHAEMAAYYRSADVIINTSISEGMPNTLLEAMNHGRAVVATDIPGNRAIIKHAVNGLLFNDDRGFFDVAFPLMEDAVYRNSLAKAAAQSVGRMFPRHQEVDAHVAIYTRVFNLAKKISLTDIRK